MTNDEKMTNPESRNQAGGSDFSYSDFGLHSSFVIRSLSFSSLGGKCHCSLQAVTSALHGGCNTGSNCSNHPSISASASAPQAAPSITSAIAGQIIRLAK